MIERLIGTDKRKPYVILYDPDDPEQTYCIYTKKEALEVISCLTETFDIKEEHGVG